nr:HlyD family efflux transporter periplasmic adaptor subunit [Betaproteobacteria bacterium]
TYKGDGKVDIDKTLLSTSHNGRIIDLPIKEGENVTKGSLLAQLRPATDCYADDLKKQKEVTRLEHELEFNRLKSNLIRNQIADLTEPEVKTMLRRALELDDRLLRNGRLIQNLNQDLNLLTLEIALGQEQLNHLQQQDYNNCPDEYIYAPFDGVIKRVFLKVNEFSNRGQGLILIQPENAAVFIHAFVSKSEMEHLAIGKKTDIIFPDNIRSIGIVEEFSSSALTFPELVWNDYEPSDARIRVHIAPLDDTEAQLWKKYDLLRVKIRGKNR